MFQRFPCYRQHSLNDCGAACLATIARVYGLSQPLSSIWEITPCEPHGATIFSLVEAARQLGFEARGVCAQPAALSQVRLPCIAHLTGRKLDHFVVIHQIKNGTMTIADPACGLVKYQLAEFTARWSGVLVLLTPGEALRKSPVWRSVQRRLGNLLTRHQAFTTSLLLIMLGVLFGLHFSLP